MPSDRVPNQFVEIANDIARDYATTTGDNAAMDLVPSEGAGGTCDAVLRIDGMEAARKSVWLGQSAGDAGIGVGAELQEFLIEVDRCIWPPCPSDGKPLRIERIDSELVWSCSDHDFRFPLGRLPAR